MAKENDNESLSFEQWFDIVKDELKANGYDGALDTDSFRLDYDLGLWAEAAAHEFLEDTGLY